MVRNALSLLELNQLLAEVIEIGMPREYWVEAEISELRVVRGHCYIDLIEKSEGTNTPIARASAKCWQNTWSVISPYFEKVTGQRLRSGMNVLMLVSANFHPAYGFSWIISDIDPTYTLGDMARKRQAIIEQLKREGVFDLQKELSLPLFCQHIAVISSANAAGYGDFVDQLESNAYGFRFVTRLFPATMQGEGVEQSVIAALNNIYETFLTSDETAPDCVVIIRGGGATSDLSGFDTLALAENVAQFPIPVITGIGHERDESILDMISHTRVKTPTAAAALLIDHLKRVWDYLQEAQGVLETNARQRMDLEQMRLQRAAQKIPPLFSLFKERQERRIDSMMRDMITAAQRSISDDMHKLETLESVIKPMLERRVTGEMHMLQMLGQRVSALDPDLLLKRGYSITLHEGKIVRDASQLKHGDKIETRVEKGTIHSIVDCEE
ncbi:exodeoxyribonuclease VII large subunit [Prevotella koreensis]|uniref:Exodeoxyribonuclease 7 large subunit n=1 Tax=Prevotella koreensis TaxID=2490854 RepID=A0A432LNL0_9BACT|nr:exodeoxyribonuclease VII large subunit [Prevotella koreensis]RUL60259.1 exodeoxyribonuclease VII large subunit [Prevotella koreensis]